jgi:hypothetical protein
MLEVDTVVQLMCQAAIVSLVANICNSPSSRDTVRSFLDLVAVSMRFHRKALLNAEDDFFVVDWMMGRLARIAVAQVRLAAAEVASCLDC